MKLIGRCHTGEKSYQAFGTISSHYKGETTQSLLGGPEMLSKGFTLKGFLKEVTARKTLATIDHPQTPIKMLGFYQ